MKKRLIFIVGVLFMIGFVSGVDYYVATTGVDSGNCQVSDCATINYALNQVSAGDTIKIKPGTYGTEQGEIIIKDSNIVITAYDKQNKPEILGTSGTEVFIHDQTDHSTSGITISYLKIRKSSSPHDGIRSPVIHLYGDNNQIDNSEIWNGGNGIVFSGYCRNQRVTNNYIHDLGTWQSSEDAHGVAFWGCSEANAVNWAEKTLIENNTIERCNGDGFQDSTQGIQTSYIEINNNTLSYFGENGIDFKGTDHVLISNNDISFANQRSPAQDPNYNQYALITCTGGGFGDPCNYIYIWNNVFHDNLFEGFGMSNAGSSDYLYIWNNIFYNLNSIPAWNEAAAINFKGTTNAYATHNSIYNVRQLSGPGRDIAGIVPGVNGDRVQNNIIFNSGDDNTNDNGAISSEGLSGDPTYNYFYSSNRGDSSCAGLCHAADNTDVTTPDPGFIDIANKDFNLLSTSANKDKGINLVNIGIYTPDIDFDGNSRDANPDIGAYEYLSSCTPTRHPADTDCSDTIDITELMTYINQWKNNEVGVTISTLFDALVIWKTG